MNKTSKLRYDDNSSYDARKIINNFVPLLINNKFFINKDYLYINSVKIEFNKHTWYRRPEVFCLDYYGEHLFYPLILLMNNVESRFSFLPYNVLMRDYIITPKKDNVLKVLDINT